MQLNTIHLLSTFLPEYRQSMPFKKVSQFQNILLRLMYGLVSEKCSFAIHIFGERICISTNGLGGKNLQNALKLTSSIYI